MTLASTSASQENPFRIYGELYPQAASHRPFSRLGPGLGPVATPRFRHSHRAKRFLRRVLLMLVAILLLGWPMFLSPQSTFRSPQVKALPVLPVPQAFISSPFGKRWGRMHQGVDLAAKTGAPVYAVSAGRVIHSGWEAGYGKSVVVDHGNGLKTRYAHCSKLLVGAGHPVGKGALIARVGSTGHSTGPHLHFEVLVGGVRKNPAWYYPLTRQAMAAYEKPQTDQPDKGWVSQALGQTTLQLQQVSRQLISKASAIRLQ